MAFYNYDQNNSGGYFEVNEKVCHRLFIEADSREEADDIAESLGVYWDGIEKGLDCPCCGDRWQSASKVGLEAINDEGWDAIVYGSSSSTEDEWNERYGNYPLHTAPKWTTNFFRSYSGKVRFESIEQYAQYLADHFGWTTPDARIFYKDGTIAEINKRKANEGADENHAD
ncbi:DUF7296 family protein [Bacillus haynesii]|uniref:DUF7296 family protein n=1 Tax=Bacillus haynesii TaxID=1925021 RepID=UPI001F61B9B4|nr:hypothetical protein [Bacillus haynesii]MCI4129405.1 hypothetical protein [Bacillus haynesii]